MKRKGWARFLLTVVLLVIFVVVPATGLAAEPEEEQETALLEMTEESYKVPVLKVLETGELTEPVQKTETAKQDDTEKTIKTTESLTVKEAIVMDIPAMNGTIVGKIAAGQVVRVYKTDIGQGWVAIVSGDDTIRFVRAETVALTAPYQYEAGGDMTCITGYTGEQLERAVAGTGLAGLGAYYAEKERTHGINALFLMAITQLESGNGTSSLAKSSNNLGGLKNGGSGYMSFDSKEECVEYMATLLRDNYLSEGGKYYNGVRVQDVCVIYCVNSASWTSQVEDLMENAYQKINGL